MCSTSQLPFSPYALPISCIFKYSTAIHLQRFQSTTAYHPLDCTFLTGNVAALNTDHTTIVSRPLLLNMKTGQLYFFEDFYNGIAVLAETVITVLSGIAVTRWPVASPHYQNPAVSFCLAITYLLGNATISTYREHVVHLSCTHLNKLNLL